MDIWEEKLCRLGADGADSSLYDLDIYVEGYFRAIKSVTAVDIGAGKGEERSSFKEDIRQ